MVVEFSIHFGETINNKSRESLRQKRIMILRQDIKIMKLIQWKFSEINFRCARKEMKYETECKIIIVSSFGAIPS
jgi:hypothetical protein